MQKFILENYLSLLYWLFFFWIGISSIAIIFILNACYIDFRNEHSFDSILFFIKIFLAYLSIIIFYILSIKQLKKILNNTTAKKDYILAVVYNLIANLPYIWLIISWLLKP